ncbi:MAG: outer membrane protein assembly factor BamB [Gammaproteobacteria bacterium]|nr:outer membrane protein assembly factor BamB [Gammaproteobacteria bacterium]
MMLFSLPKRLLVALLILVLSACDTPDNSEPPAELTDIENAEYVRERWSVDTGKGAIENFFDMQPLVLGPKIFTIDTTGLIQQIDSKKGKIEWSFESGLTAIAGLSGNEQYLVATSSEGQVSLFERNTEDLTLLWQTNLNSEIRSRAILDGQQVFARTVDGHLSAINTADGAVSWSLSRRVPALSLTGHSHPIVTEDLVISGFDNGKLLALEKDDGTVIWEATVGVPTGRTEIERLIDLDGQFIVRDGVIYICAFQGKLAAITVNSGQVLWTRKFSSFQAIEADNESLYITDDRSHLWSIDRRTGSAFWKQDILNARKITAPRLVDDKLVVADLEGYVHWFNKQDGKLVSRIATHGHRYISQPVALDTHAIVLDASGQLTALTQKR